MQVLFGHSSIEFISCIIFVVETTGSTSSRATVIQYWINGQIYWRYYIADIANGLTLKFKDICFVFHIFSTTTIDHLIVLCPLSTQRVQFNNTRHRHHHRCRLLQSLQSWTFSNVFTISVCGSVTILDKMSPPTTSETDANIVTSLLCDTNSTASDNQSIFMCRRKTLVGVMSLTTATLTKANIVATFLLDTITTASDN